MPTSSGCGGALRGVEENEVREIVEELRSHILEKAVGGDVDSALAALGGPEELAGRYLTDSLLARAAGSRSPVRLLRSLLRWASLSLGWLLCAVGIRARVFLRRRFHSGGALQAVSSQNAGIWTYATLRAIWGFPFGWAMGTRREWARNHWAGGLCRWGCWWVADWSCSPRALPCGA